MDSKYEYPKAWLLLRAALVFALAFSAWAAFGSAGCGACSGAVGFFGGQRLAILGTLYYASLFLAAVVAGPCLFVYGGILVATGVHAGLVAVLLTAKIICPLCLASAGAALLGTFCAIKIDPGNIFRAGFIVPVAAFAVQGWALFSGALPAAREAREIARRAVQEELVVPRESPGRVRMVVYTRDDCGYCRVLDRDLLPDIQREFGSRLSVEHRSAEGLPGIPTPTLILTGSESRRFFPGLPPKEHLRDAIASLMGNDHEGSALSPKPR